MKRWLLIALIAGMLTGCSGVQSSVSRAVGLRSKLLQGSGCTFDAVITADYGEKLYTFTMKNTVDSSGNLTFEVVLPETISGISGRITDEAGALTFDDKVLAFELLADEQITPVSAPWILMKTLRGGYIRACESTDSGLHIQIDDSYEDDALQMEIWTNQEDIPIRGEILFRGRRILSLNVENFSIL